MRNALALSLSLVTLVGNTGCASSPSSRPTVTLTERSEVDIVAAVATTAVPVDYRLDVANPLPANVILKSVEIETVGLSGSYQMKRVRHQFEQIIPAGSTASVNLRAWVIPLQETAGGRIGNAVMVRGSARFDLHGRTLRTQFVARFGRRAAGVPSGH